MTVRLYHREHSFTGSAELDAGEPSAPDRLREALAATTDPAARVRILQRLCLALIQSDRAAEAVALVDDALANLHGSDPQFAEVLEAIAVSCHRDLDVARALQQRSRALCLRAADPRVTHPVTLAVAATATAWANRPATEVWALAERAIAGLRGGYSAALPGFGIDGQLGVALMSAERFDVLFALSEPGLADARRRGLAPAVVGIGARYSAEPGQDRHRPPPPCAGCYREAIYFIRSSAVAGAH